MDKVDFVVSGYGTNLIVPALPIVMERGMAVFVSASIPPNAFEGWVQAVEVRSGVRLDWGYFAGRSVVRALERFNHVQATIRSMMPEHDALYRERWPDAENSNCYFPLVEEAV